MAWIAIKMKKSLLNLSVITMIKNGYSVDDATYVYNPSVKTPMAYNVLSFKDKASAEAFSTENEGSTLMTANELAQHGWEQNQDMMQKNMMENHSHSEPMDTEHSEMSQQ